jgi:hypothetical protein
MSIAICNHTKCSKYKECWRSQCEIADNTYIDFKNICGEWNNFHYIWNIGNNPIRKEELKE